MFTMKIATEDRRWIHQKAFEHIVGLSGGYEDGVFLDNGTCKAATDHVVVTWDVGYYDQSGGTLEDDGTRRCISSLGTLTARIEPSWRFDGIWFRYTKRTEYMPRTFCHLHDAPEGSFDGTARSLEIRA